jgi:hypothetical protein
MIFCVEIKERKITIDSRAAIHQAFGRSLECHPNRTDSGQWSGGGVGEDHKE